MSILNYYDPEIKNSGGGSKGTLGPSLVRAPVGTIVVWSGDMDNIPDGWALCDGQDGARAERITQVPQGPWAAAGTWPTPPSVTSSR